MSALCYCKTPRLKKSTQGHPFCEKCGNWFDDKSNGLNRTPARSDKIGRNDPCPCRSGLKFKKCHGGPLAQIPGNLKEAQVKACQRIRTALGKVNP